MTRVTGGLGSGGLTAGHDNLRGLLNLNDFMIL